MSFFPGFDDPRTCGAYGQPLHRPPASNPTTSAAAAEAIAADVPHLERVVLDWLRNHGPATDEAGIAGTGLPPSTFRPRRVSLVQRGLVADTGRTAVLASGRRGILWGCTAEGGAA